MTEIHTMLAYFHQTAYVIKTVYLALAVIVNTAKTITLNLSYCSMPFADM